MKLQNQNRQRRGLVLPLAVLLLFMILFTMSPFLHNHDADFEEHGSCPSFLIQLAFVSTVISFIFIFVFFLDSSKETFLYSTLAPVAGVTSTSHSRRGPPLS